MALLDHRRGGTRHADAVAAGLGNSFLTRRIQHAGLHRAGVDVAKLEDVPDFDAAHERELALPVRARIAGDDLAQVGSLWLGAVAAPVDALEVMIVFVRTANEV